MFLYEGVVFNAEVFFVVMCLLLPLGSEPKLVVNFVPLGVVVGLLVPAVERLLGALVVVVIAIRYQPRNKYAHLAGRGLPGLYVL